MTSIYREICTPINIPTDTPYIKIPSHTNTPNPVPDTYMNTPPYIGSVPQPSAPCIDEPPKYYNTSQETKPLYPMPVHGNINQTPPSVVNNYNYRQTYRRRQSLLSMLLTMLCFSSEQ